MTNVNPTFVRNVYVDQTVVVNHYYTTANVSYNGGPQGVQAAPTAAERSFENERRFQPTAPQQEHAVMASRDRTLLASVNHGRPAAAAVAAPITQRSLPPSFTPVRPEDRAGGRVPVTGAIQTRTPAVRTAHIASSQAQPATLTPQAHAPSYARPQAGFQPAQNAPARREQGAPPAPRPASVAHQSAPAHTQQRPPARPSAPPNGAEHERHDRD